MASVRKLKKDDPASPWIVEYTDPSGARRRATPKSGLKKDAIALRTKIETELARGEHVPLSQTVTVAEALDAWLEKTRKRVASDDNLRKTTAVNYYLVAENYIRPKLGTVKLSQLTFPRVQSWIEEIAYKDDRLLSKAHVEKIVFILKCVLDDAFAQGLVGRNVVSAHRYRVPGKAAGKVEIPEKAEVKAFLESAAIIARGRSAPYLRTFLSLIVYGGLRAGEARGLLWSNVDFDARVIRVRQQITRLNEVSEPKTQAGVRDIPIAAPLLLELKQWHIATSMYSREKANGYVFYSRRFAPLNHDCVWGSFAALQRRLAGRTHAGVERGRYDLHAMRHVAASLFIESGLPPKRIQAIMGHTSIKMTFDLYGHLFEDAEAIRKAVDRISLETAS